MSKNKIIKTLAACAIGLSVLLCVLIYQFMAPARDTIYVFNDSYSLGTQVTEDMLSPIQVDATITLAGKKSDVSSAFITPNDYASVIKSGDSLRMDVNKGMPLTTSMLSTTGGSSVEMNMQSDAIAVTIPVDQFSGVTNDLKEGARVNIYASTDSETELIQQNKRILEVYYQDGVIVGVSVEENVSESMELIYAATYGKIYLGLVDGTGYQAVEGEGLVYNPYTQPVLPETEENTENAETESVESENQKDSVFTP